jgi:hypothetical protein
MVDAAVIPAERRNGGCGGAVDFRCSRGQHEAAIPNDRRAMQIDERIEGMTVKIEIGKQGAKAYRIAKPPAATCCNRHVQVGHGALDARFDAAIIITLQGWLRWGLLHPQPLEALPGQVKPGVDEPF